MRQTIATVVVAVMAATAGCGTPGATTLGQDGTDTTAAGDRTVAVTASAQVEAEPDRAVVRVAVTARGETAESVRRELANDSTQLRDAVRGAGVNDSQLTTTDYRIDSDPDPRPGEAPFSGRHGFEIAVHDPDRAGRIVVTAVENGASDVGGIRFTLAPDTRRELRREALTLALEEARGKAVVAAGGTNLTLAGTRTVRTADVSVESDRRDAAYRTAANAEAATAVDGGPVSVSVRIVVVYDATNAE